jgi:formate hydrogenlyase transcriptional activator
MIQPKLLRVLQDKEFERLGSNRTVKVDVRSDRRDKSRLAPEYHADGRFREDLFYRLKVFPIYVPPLRERKSDIPALVRYFVARYASEAKKSIASYPRRSHGCPGELGLAGEHQRIAKSGTAMRDLDKLHQS